jgi:hypothetical protein
MKRNWITHLIVLCSGATATGFLFMAYHSATYPWAFPDSPATRWLGRFEELFPNLGVLPRLLLQLSGILRPGGVAAQSRWLAMILNVVLAAATAALTYGLARHLIWARTTFGITALLQFLSALLKLAPLALHLIAAGAMGIKGSLNGLASAGVPPQYTVLGAFFAAGIAWLMWRWRNETASEDALQADAARPHTLPLVLTAGTDAQRRGLSRWTWGMRGALLLQLITFTWLVFPAPAAWKNWNGTEILALLIWIAVPGAIWYLLSREDPRFGVGLGLGCAGVQVIPALGFPILALMLGFQTWFQLGLVLLGVAAVFVLLVSGIVATIFLGKPPLERAGIWGLGVLLPFVVAAVFLQAEQESTYAKGPKLSRERTIEQSNEYEMGHAAHEMVRLIAKCAFEYASAHPQEGFPEKLEQLGPGGSGCLPIVPGKPLVEGHEFEYQSSSRASSGPRDRFTARSKEPQHPPGTFSLPDLLVDESGVFVTQDGNRPFSFSPALALLNNIAACLNRDFVARGGISYPSSLRGLLSIKADYGVPCVPSFEANELSVIGLWSDRFLYSFYGFTYTPTDGTNGAFKGFHLEARPAEYGKKALRSYLADQTGIVHVTPMNRAATFNDPDAACEAKQESCSVP